MPTARARFNPAAVAVWDGAALAPPSKVHPAEQRPAKGMRSLFYEGAHYKGQPTWVFAYYAPPEGDAPEGGWPAVVCAHGGGGTAYPAWMRKWNSHEYAPRWSRHHDHMSSVSTVVSSGGRLFTIFDEGSPASIFLPSKWSLIARDAFNGRTLWKRPIPNWHTQLWPLKSGPAQLARRLVAVDDTVYAVLDIDAPLAALDAATGATLRTYPGTKATEEILCSEGVLFAVVRPEGVESEMHRTGYESLNEVRNHRRDWQWRQEEPRTIVAFDAAGGALLWGRGTSALRLIPSLPRCAWRFRPHGDRNRPLASHPNRGAIRAV